MSSVRKSFKLGAEIFQPFTTRKYVSTATPRRLLPLEKKCPSMTEQKRYADAEEHFKKALNMVKKRGFIREFFEGVDVRLKDRRPDVPEELLERLEAGAAAGDYHRTQVWAGQSAAMARPIAAEQLLAGI